MIQAIAILGMIWIAISAVYFMKNKKTGATEGNYIWVGPGEDPFKREE